MSGLATAEGWSLDDIVVTLVYYVPRDRQPLPDWRQRLGYYSARIVAFHHRELGEQSRLTTAIHDEPFSSPQSTEELRVGDPTFTFLQTLGEVDRALGFARGERTGFPILLVMSDINWGDLDDFYRQRRTAAGTTFDGQIVRGRHVPGSPAGGSRATYIPDRGIGWGLVSGDGWRVPYTGSDCVVYHEGVGHAIGLRHPEPTDGSVMGQAQYGGWLHQTWIAAAQKRALGATSVPATTGDLFSTFTAVPEPATPAPGQEIALRMTWPADARVLTCRVAYQTALLGAWIEHILEGDAARGPIGLGRFTEPTPVSYRVHATLADQQTAELWGYFQVRAQADAAPQPAIEGSPVRERSPSHDLLPLLGAPVVGDRRSLPIELPAAYTLLAIVTRLDAAPALALEIPIGTARVRIVLADQLITDRPVAITIRASERSVSITCEGLTATHRAPDEESPTDHRLVLDPLGGRFCFDHLSVIAG